MSTTTTPPLDSRTPSRQNSFSLFPNGEACDARSRVTQLLKTPPSWTCTIGEHDVPGYRLLRRIGGGGMGCVFEAIRLGTARRVAIKFNVINGGEAAQRFAREGRTMESLQKLQKIRNRFVPEFYDAGTTPRGLQFLVMELVEGLNLKQHVTKHGPLSLDEVHRFAKNIAFALEHAHSNGIIHRDVKPQNVMVRSDGTGVLVDWGLSRPEPRTAIDATLSTGWLVTRHPTIVGTPHFMAPEMIRMEPATTKVDQFSLGCVIYFLVRGKPPLHWRRNAMDVMAHRTTLPSPPQLFSGSHAEEISLSLATIYRRLMAYRPERRFRTTLAIVKELEKSGTAGAKLVDPASIDWVRKVRVE